MKYIFIINLFKFINADIIFYKSNQTWFFLILKKQHIFWFFLGWGNISRVWSLAHAWGYLLGMPLISITILLGGELWQNHPNYMAYMHLSLSLRPLTTVHESQITQGVYRVSSGNLESSISFFWPGSIIEDIAVLQQFAQIHKHVTSE